MHGRRGTKRFLAYLLVGILLLSGCNGSGQRQGKNPEEESPPFNVSLANADGSMVYFSQKPTKIVSFLPSATDTLKALGAESTLVSANALDQVFELKPDLVIVGVAQNEKDASVLEEVKNAGSQVLVIEDSTNFAVIFRMIENLGRLTEAEEKAEAINSELKTTIEDVSKKARGTSLNLTKRVWVETTPGADAQTAGQGTYLAEMLYYISALNIGEKTKGFGTVPENEVLYSDPEMIFLTYGGKDNVSKVYQRKNWRNCTAIRNKQVIQLDSEIFSHPGPRLAEGLKILANAVYPEVFDYKIE